MTVKNIKFMTIALNKQQLINAYYCQKEPYLSILKPSKRGPDTPLKESIIGRAEKVKALSRQLFPEGIDLSNDGTVTGQDLINKTRMVLNADTDLVFFNAAFNSSDRTMESIVDILVVGSKRADMYILKSATKIKEPDYILEAGFKYSTVKSSWYKKPLRVFLLTINKDYILKDKHNIDELFTIQEITTKAKRNVWMIMKYKRRLEKALSKRKAPQQTKKITFCTSPHACNFYDYCWSDKGGKKLKEPFIKMNKAKKCFTRYNFSKPHYYLDIGTFQPNLPKYVGTKPYQKIPYQYCALYKATGESKYEIKVFYGEPVTDPRIEFIRSFLEDTKTPGFIFVYSEEITKAILQGLADCFSEYSLELAERIGRLRYIEEPFEKPKKQYQRRVYYYPKSRIISTLNNQLSVWENDEDKYRLDLESYYSFSTIDIASRIALKRSMQNYCYKEALSLITIVTFYLGK